MEETEIERLRREYALMERSCQIAYEAWDACLQTCAKRLERIAELEAELVLLRGR